MPPPIPSLRVRLDNLRLSWKEDQEDAPAALLRAAATRLRLQPEALAGSLKLVRRALDLRQQCLWVRCTVELTLPTPLARRLLRQRRVQPLSAEAYVLPRLAARPSGPRPVVVGAGPAGLFAALTLAEAGVPPILIERGKPVEARARDVARLYAQGELLPESNVCFGEGGAGTFSDGKLYTRVGDLRVRRVMQLMVDHGAPPRILTDNRPHLGTDRLVRLLRRIRARLEELGTSLRFSTQVGGWAVDKAGEPSLRGLHLKDGDFVPAQQAIVCTGHSARDVWESLLAAGLPLETRPFAMGFRIEHPQALINAARYGAHASQTDLPAADYRLVHQEADRGVWSFCMCPGGVVVTTPTQAGELCINGMSHAARSGHFANSAVVASCGPADFAAAGMTGLFAGADLQRACEKAAFAAGGGQFAAPACRVDAFLADRPPAALGRTSYRRGLSPSPSAAPWRPSSRRSLVSAARRQP
jgi:uncharacterized FAD-dependent dehydrogenase